MAKGVGLDAGEYEVKVAELDGSLRKPRLAKVSIEVVEPVESGGGDEMHAQHEAASALHALKDAHVSRENVALAFPCREAVVRTMTVPFTGIDAIRKVIKFEAEGTIHSHNVDDMVVDFNVLEEGKGETKVMVVAVPKMPLRTTLTALERAGIEPEVVDLDAMALFRAAEFCGAISGSLGAAEGAPEIGTERATEGKVAAAESKAAPALPASPERQPVRLVIDMGARSTRILIVVGGRLLDMRALRTGTDSLADEIAALMGVSLSQARRAILASLQSGEDFVVEEAAGTAARGAEVAGEADSGEGARAVEGGGGLPLVAAPDAIPHQTILQARDRFLDVLRRELVRFLARSPGAIEAVWVTGGGSMLPGAVDLLEEVFDVRPRPLDVLGSLQHNLDEEEARNIAPRIATAVGLALRMMGGPAGFNFRQEDLAFARRFDRVKFPLTIACMLALFLVVVYGLKTNRELAALENEVGALYAAPKVDGRGRIDPKSTRFTGYVHTVMTGPFFAKYYDSKKLDTLYEKLLQATTFERLPVISKALDQYLQEEEKKGGYFREMPQLESGLAVLVRMAEIIKGIEPQLGRYLMMRVELTIPPNENGRYLEFVVALRGGEFRHQSEIIVDAFKSDAAKPDSPFLAIEKGQDAKLFKDTEEPGFYYTVKVSLKKQIAPFP